ncbi:MAG: B12-binding domain-containing radical SAM protein [Planctomycetota bacterium]|jgi:radical SAM superfamily enzyme YgiQ (UPF0313 family)
MITSNILLVYPEFPTYGFWNYKEVCRLVGAKYPAAPLGLITLAALLPKSWNMKLVDMNTTELLDRDIDEADLVFIGGMLSQQADSLRLIDRIHGRGKKVVAGGPDPTAQPEVYERADYLVLGEVEDTIAAFLKDLAEGAERGVYPSAQKRPEITRSPVPRFDLLDFKNYLMIGIQVTRGCPYDCEFCDIIELYGRIPRMKTPEQVVTELDALYGLGYRGHVDFVDDNFIGNKRKARAILKAVRDWSAEHGYPFCFSTEATINLADDDELLGLMREADFRYVFIGIESVDEDVLTLSKKRTNLRRNFAGDVDKIHGHGIVVNGGFIIGFDNETSASVRSIADIVQRTNICMAMIGLLYALPRTQLTRRLTREGRFIENVNLLEGNDGTAIDQTTSGLNFITKRPRGEVYEDFIQVLEDVYAPKHYFDRCLKLGLALKRKVKHKHSLNAKRKAALGFFRLVRKLGFKPSTAYLFWRNIVLLLFRRPSSLEETTNLMALYIHFRQQTDNTLKLISNASKDLDRPQVVQAVSPHVTRQSDKTSSSHGVN